MELMKAILLGALFGLALYKAGASKPEKLLDMLSLRNLSLMKIILFAIGFSSILLFLANTIGIFDVSHLHIKSTNFGVVIGGLIFGIGFGTAGTCPGTCVAAAGTNGFRRALFSILGGLLGAFAFSMTYGFWNQVGLFDTMNLGKLTLFNVLEENPSVFRLGFSGLLITGILFILIAVILPSKIGEDAISQ